MILIDNIAYLKKKHADVWEQLKTIEDKPSMINLQMRTSKSEQPTLSIDVEGEPIYVHSKYNPLEEAEQLINRITDLDKYEHIFFYGVGLGYHVDALLKKYPDKNITLYEPEPEVFAQYLSRKSLNDYPKKQIKSIFIENNVQQKLNFLNNFVNNLNEEMFLIHLPSYERIFKEKYVEFNKLFAQIIAERKSMFQVYSAFEKRWTFNSMVNLETTLRTPNIISQKKHVFAGKPVIIVAAGPSLQEEIKNLKMIKNQGTAYIIAVGTSINALLVNDLMPDAVCTYDPSPANEKVFERLKSEGKTDIPIIYGSSIGYEVIKDYPGPKLHMLTNQDGISNFYLKNKDNKPVDVILDAPSISVVALQLFQKVKSNPIIFVGQNLAYKNNQAYSPGANVITGDDTIPLSPINSILLKSVNGDQIESTKDYNLMKTQLELFAPTDDGREIINSTAGGAHIEHTTYISLSELMENRLKNRVVQPGWFDFEESCYDTMYAEQQVALMKIEHQQMMKYFDQMTHFFQDMNRGADRRNIKQLGKIFPVFDKLFTKILDNKFFDTYVRPMNKVHLDLLMQNVERMRFENDYISKARTVIKEFGKFIYGCHSDALNIEPLVELNYQELINYTQKES